MVFVTLWELIKSCDLFSTLVELALRLAIQIILAANGWLQDTGIQPKAIIPFASNLSATFTS